MFHMHHIKKNRNIGQGLKKIQNLSNRKYYTYSPKALDVRVILFETNTIYLPERDMVGFVFSSLRLFGSTYVVKPEKEKKSRFLLILFFFLRKMTRKEVKVGTELNPETENMNREKKDKKRSKRKC